MDRSPRVIEHGRAPASRDGTRRPLAHLAAHLLSCIPGAALVTLHSRRPAHEDDDLLVWASVWLRGRSKGKIPERKVPAVVLAASELSLEELERREIEALVLSLTGSLPPEGEEPPAGSRPPFLRVLRPLPTPPEPARGSPGPEPVAEPEPPEPPPRLAPAGSDEEARPPRVHGFLRVLDGGLS